MDNVVFFNGDDDLLLQRAVERWLASLTATHDVVDVHTYDAAELDELPELRTTSLFGGTNCVVVRGVEAVTGDLKAQIEQYLEDPATDAVLVLVAKGVGRIPKIAKLAGAAGDRHDVKRPTDWDDRAWTAIVADEFGRLGRQPDAAAIAAVRLHAGNDTAAIASQVATVCAVSAGQSTVTAADVEQVLEGQGRATGFAVADAIAERDPAAALVALRGALAAGEAPLALMGAIVFRVRQLLQVRSGASAQQAGMSPGQHRRVQQVARAFGPGELAWCHHRLAELDLALKSAELPDDLMLEVAVVELATSRDVGAPFNPLAATAR